MIALVCFAVNFSVPSLIAGVQSDPLKDFPNRVKKITLKNGMRVLLVERPQSPTVSFAAFIRTGGIDDETGKSGLAHMFEHMLFKGSKTVGTKNYAAEVPLLEKMDEIERKIQREWADARPGVEDRVKALRAQMDELEGKHRELLEEEEFWKIYERAGAQGLNASTGYDFTNYVVSLPVNQIPLWMAMESDRIRNPVLREFYKERSVVQEERRLRIDTSPQGKLWESFLAAAFMAHPYGRPIIGWDSDVSRLTVDDARRFFKTHYDISRLVIAAVGGFDAEEMERLFRRHFEGIPSVLTESPAPIPVEPKQEGERRVTVEYDAEPSLLIGYHRPSGLHPDDASLHVLAQVLDAGRTSRFYKEIVDKKKIAASAWADSSGPGQRDPNLFLMGGAPRSPHTTEDLEKAMYAQVETVKKDGPTPFELEKIKNNIVYSAISEMSSNSGLAGSLAYYEAIAGDWQRLLMDVEAVLKVTAEDVKRVAEQYLTPSNRTVAVLRRKG